MGIEFEVSRDFSQSPREIFEVLTDLDRATEWVPGLLEIEQVGEGPFGPQTRWIETRSFLGKEATEEFEVTSFGPPAVLVIRAHGNRGGSAHGEYVFRYRLVPEGTGTRVTLRGEVRGLQGLTKWLSQLFARTYKEARTRDLDALAEYLDGPPT